MYIRITPDNIQTLKPNELLSEVAKRTKNYDCTRSYALTNAIRFDFSDADCNVLLSELQAVKDALNTETGNADAEPTVSDTPIVGWNAVSKNTDLEVGVLATAGYLVKSNWFCGRVTTPFGYYHVGYYSESWNISDFTFHKPTTV